MPTIRPQTVQQKVEGKRGDGVPFSPLVFRFTFTGETIVKGNWSALAQLRVNPDSEVLAHQFTTTLRDSTDGVGLTTEQLEVELTPLTGAQSAALGVGEWVGDLQITQSGGQPQTWVDLKFTILEDVSR